jgi:predicted transcriptional regulator
MKTFVSIPNDIFDRAERLAKGTNRSRSRVYSDALRQYVARHSHSEITLAINKACAKLGGAHEPFTALAAKDVLKMDEW